MCRNEVKNRFFDTVQAVLQHFRLTSNELRAFTELPHFRSTSRLPTELRSNFRSSEVCRFPLGKTAGLDEVAPEMLKCGGVDITHALTSLMNVCWSKSVVPEDWRRGMIIRLPKKGDLTKCDNWRGITLLSVPGKVFCVVLLRRLQQSVDNQLREQQAGFRRGRSCGSDTFARTFRYSSGSTGSQKSIGSRTWAVSSPAMGTPITSLAVYLARHQPYTSAFNRFCSRLHSL